MSLFVCHRVAACAFERLTSSGVPESMDENAKVSMKLDIHGTPAENLQRLIRDCGVSPHKVGPPFRPLLMYQLQELVQELPPKAFADKIIDWFFSKLNYVRYPLDERLFRQCRFSSRSGSGCMLRDLAYDDLYSSPTIDPSNVRALPQVFIVLALAVRLAPAEWAGDDQTRKLSSLRLYWSCELL